MTFNASQTPKHPHCFLFHADMFFSRSLTHVHTMSPEAFLCHVMLMLIWRCLCPDLLMFHHVLDNGNTSSRPQKFNVAFLDCDDLSLNASFFNFSPVLFLFFQKRRPVIKLRNCDVFPVLVLRVSLSNCQHAPRHPACLRTSRVGTRTATQNPNSFLMHRLRSADPAAQWLLTRAGRHGHFRRDPDACR